MSSAPLPSHVYYDVIISNLSTKDDKPTQASFNQARSTPYLQDPSQYYLSIIRWSLDTYSLPIFVPTMAPNAGIDGHDANETIYTITLQYGDELVRQPIIFIPQDKDAEVPVAPGLLNGVQQNSGGYYNVYNYAYLIWLVNTALSTCFAELALVAPLPTDKAPFLTFDPTSKIAIMNCALDGFGVDTAGGPVDIYFNTNLAGLFSSFPFERSKVFNRGRNFKFLTDTLGVSTIMLYPPDVVPEEQYKVIQVYQENSTIATWNPVASLAIMSNTLGVIQNIDGKPTLYYNNVLINGTGNNSVSSNLITDFIADSYQPNVIYVPSAEFRRIELVGTNPLTNLDISIYWKNRIGEYLPFYLPAGGTATIKIMFEKRP